MELNLKLPKELRLKLAKKTNMEPLYCVKTNISLSGEYVKRAYVGTTEKEIFIFYDDQEQYISISNIKTATCHNMVNGGVLSITKDDEEIIIARCSMTDISRFACLAKGIKWLCEGEIDKRVINHDREKYCFNCGRVLPGTNHCPKCDKQHRNFNRLLGICKPHATILTLIVTLMLLGSAIDLSVQFVLRYFVDGYLVAGKGNGLNILVFFAVYFGITVISAVGYLYRTYLCNKLGISVTYKLREQLNNHIQKLSLSFLGKRNPGAVIERVMGDTNHVKGFICDCFCNMFSMMVTLIALVFLMLILNWKLAIAAFVFAPLIVVFARTFGLKSGGFIIINIGVPTEFRISFKMFCRELE